jgi:tRNA (mo5U34)-methyltransferase
LTARQGGLNTAALRDEVIRLGPWHIDIEITPEVSTRAFLDAPPGTYAKELGEISFYSPRAGFLRRLGRLFPDGLEGRSVLDCACNCGAHLFYAKEAGAGRCFGFDVREHWIDQARFLAAHRTGPSDDMRFEVSDLHDLPALAPGSFDVTFFFGLFYHLPDPVIGLKLAADQTEELLVLRTATKAGHADGTLAIERESSTQLMSGAYGIGWFPTGPEVLTRILAWLGFPEVRCSLWRHPPQQREDLDLLELLAARRSGYFDGWDARGAWGAEGVAEAIETCVPPGATVLVMSDNDTVPDLHSRDAVRLARGLDELARRRGEGAGYVAVPEPAALPEPVSQLEQHGRVIFDGPACRVYALEGPPA